MDDGGRPTEAAVRAEASNHPEVLQAKSCGAERQGKGSMKLSGTCHGDERE